jgi:hypothetical protein
MAPAKIEFSPPPKKKKFNLLSTTTIFFLFLKKKKPNKAADIKLESKKEKTIRKNHQMPQIKK